MTLQPILKNAPFEVKTAVGIFWVKLDCILLHHLVTRCSPYTHVSRIVRTLFVKTHKHFLSLSLSLSLSVSNKPKNFLSRSHILEPIFSFYVSCCHAVSSFCQFQSIKIKIFLQQFVSVQRVPLSPCDEGMQVPITVYCVCI